MAIYKPKAEVIVWNYDARFRTGFSSPHTISETLLLGQHIQRIGISKQKASPTGGFEIHLAPTYNWLAKITPGSWCAILMTSKYDLSGMSSANVGTAREETLKLFGRIDSVRVVSSVSEEGSRQLSYVATGVDWGSVFETEMYLDPLILQQVSAGTNSLGEAQAVAYTNWLNDLLSQNKPIPNTTDNIKQLIKFWSNTAGTVVGKILENAPSLGGMVFNSGAQYQIPGPVQKFMDLNSSNIADSLKVVSGKLVSYDTYKDTDESHQFIQPNSLIGTHTMWQLINDNSNHLINECIADLRWNNGSPGLALYKRIRPFLIKKPSSTPPETLINMSFFKDIKRHSIDRGDILYCNAGTNWRDAVNFIEVMPADAAVDYQIITNQAKMEAQTANLPGFLRDGMRSMIVSSPFRIFHGMGPQGLSYQYAQTQWKHLLAEWYFNTQNMLNGSISFTGQDFYIGVGDNIMFSADVLGYAPFNDQQIMSSNILAHVESVSHDFSVNGEGASSFTTTVSFVRGVICDNGGKPLLLGTGAAIDSNAGDLAEDMEKQPNVINKRG